MKLLNRLLSLFKKRKYREIVVDGTVKAVVLVEKGEKLTQKERAARYMAWKKEYL